MQGLPGLPDGSWLGEFSNPAAAAAEEDDWLTGVLQGEDEVPMPGSPSMSGELVSELEGCTRQAHALTQELLHAPAAPAACALTAPRRVRAGSAVQPPAQHAEPKHVQPQLQHGRPAGRTQAQRALPGAPARCACSRSGASPSASHSPPRRALGAHQPRARTHGALAWPLSSPRCRACQSWAQRSRTRSQRSREASCSATGSNTWTPTRSRRTPCCPNPWVPWQLPPGLAVAWTWALCPARAMQCLQAAW